MKMNDTNLVFLFLISLCLIVFGLKMEVAADAQAEWAQSAQLSQNLYY